MKEGKEYFSDMERHRIPFEYVGPDDDAAIVLVSTHYFIPISSFFYHFTFFRVGAISSVSSFSPHSFFYF